MKSTHSSSINPRLDLRLAAYAAAGAALAAPAASHTAQAAIVTSGPVNITVPNTADGLYINFVTGATATSAFTGYDFNPYSSGTALLFYWGGTATVNAGVAASTTGPYLVLAPGSVVSSTSIFSQSANGANNETSAYLAGVTGYLGVKFTNESTGALDYGYVHIRTTSGSGFPATILDYAYENNGGAITIPNAVPEPATNVALGLGALALGAVSVRRMRQRKQAAA